MEIIHDPTTILTELDLPHKEGYIYTRYHGIIWRLNIKGMETIRLSLLDKLKSILQFRDIQPSENEKIITVFYEILNDQVRLNERPKVVFEYIAITTPL